ncbi:hypothetical protein VOI54_03770 [Tamlana sp. 2201CG12-4]|uniref:hypothetical protein n=1 Tax=Tamlana sp. 2201CG12-4 TaxID=3112582 RepID=UPI002DB7F984|nr:hypothetical protein [Tamlana sp. 2201CG12-4]MEC3906121.1 hypothetical protein [Tamlana sp. 2201CG12-4]
MATQGERQDFLWRPNTNDSTNLTRYEAEVELWLKAFKSAERKYSRKPFQESVTVIGLVLSLTVNLIWMVGLLGVRVFQWLRKQ